MQPSQRPQPQRHARTTTPSQHAATPTAQALTCSCARCWHSRAGGRLLWLLQHMHMRCHACTRSSPHFIAAVRTRASVASSSRWLQPQQLAASQCSGVRARCRLSLRRRNAQGMQLRRGGACGFVCGCGECCLQPASFLFIAKRKAAIG